MTRVGSRLVTLEAELSHKHSAAWASVVGSRSSGPRTPCTGLPYLPSWKLLWSTPRLSSKRNGDEWTIERLVIVGPLLQSLVTLTLMCFLSPGSYLLSIRAGPGPWVAQALLWLKLSLGQPGGNKLCPSS